MKTIFEKLFFLLLALSIFSSCNQSLDDNNFQDNKRGNIEEFASSIRIGDRHIQVDDKNVEQLADGIKYIKLQLKEESYPLVVHALQMDRNMKDLSVQLLSGKKKVKGREKVSAMVSNNTNEQQEVLAAINADFFEFAAASPLGGQIVNNVVQRLIPKSWNTAFYTDELGIPHVGKLVTSAFVSSPNIPSSYEITDYNSSRIADSMILYDSSFTQDNTGTNPYGGEVLLKPIDFEWGKVTSDNLLGLKFTVEKMTTMETGGAMPIPEGKIILSAHGKAYTWLSKLTVGNEISIDISLKNRNYLQQSLDISNLCGAHQIILKNAVKEKTGGTDELITARHPRSCIGYSPDRKKVTMLVVEGRSDISVGANLSELADICSYFNMADAANLDGGGSSAIVGKGKVLNTLSDGEERAVVNAIAFVRSKKQ